MVTLHSKPADDHCHRRQAARPGDRAESALIAAGAEIFQRGVLVRPAVIELPASDNRKTQAAVLADVTSPGMIDELSRSRIGKSGTNERNARSQPILPTSWPP